MENLGTVTGAEFLHLGVTEVLFDNDNKKGFRLNLCHPLCGVEKLSFIFVRDRRTTLLHLPYPKKKTRVLVKDKGVETTTLVSSSDFRNLSKLVAIATKTINAHVRGNNSKMLGLSLFYNVSRIDVMVKAPIPVADLMRKPYDINVPVVSSRSGVTILVPIQVKSGYHQQSKHIVRHPRIPSVLIDIDAVDRKVEAAQRLLSQYVNEGVVLHI
jgi:hypothetical protein